jgi:CRISPR-associated protein Csb2
MADLVLQCRFVAHSYQGVRQGRDRDEELDWPPAPGRIHQSLISVALRGLPVADGVGAADALEALRWLEGQPPPEIVASAICENADSSTHFRVAIPQNNPARSDLTKTSVLLKPTPMLRAVGRSGEPLRVDYVWRLGEPAALDAAERRLSDLADLVAQVRYLGRSEDQVEMRLELRGDDCGDAVPEASETWKPSDRFTDAELWVARPNSTDELIQNHAEPVPERTRRPPASRFLREQGYSREATAGLLPVSRSDISAFRRFRGSGRTAAFLRRRECGNLAGDDQAGGGRSCPRPRALGRPRSRCRIGDRTSPRRSRQERAAALGVCAFAFDRCAR